MTLWRGLHCSPPSARRRKQRFYHEMRKMMERHVDEAIQWGNRRRTALEAQGGWPLFSVSLCSSGSGTQSTHSPSDLIKAGSKRWQSHERLQIGVGEGSNSLVIWCDVVCREGEKLWGLRGVEIVTALEKLMWMWLTWMLCCSVTFGGKDNILAFYPFRFLTLGHDFIVSFFTAFSILLGDGSM